MFQHLLLLTAALLHLNVSPCEAVDFYVRPTQPTNQTCTEPCHTLDQYAQNVSLFEGQTNISFLFLSGEHVLTYNLSIAGHNELVMSGLDSNANRAVIDLQSKTEINVTSMAIFGLYNITIKGTLIYEYAFITYIFGQPFYINNVQNVSQYQVEMANIDVHIRSKEITVLSTAITKCNYSNSTVQFSSESTNKAKIRIQETDITEIKASYINELRNGLSYTCVSQQSLDMELQNITVRGWFTGVKIDCIVLSDSQLKISKNSVISGNGNGLNIATDIHTVTIYDTQFMYNFYAGIYINSENLNLSYLRIQDTKFMYNVDGFYSSNTNLHNMVVRDSEFSKNDNAGVHIATGTVTNASFSETLFSHNSNFGLTLLSTASVCADQGLNRLLLQNCTVASNNGTGIALTNFRAEITVTDSTFKENVGTPLLAYQSDFELGGETIFLDNVAVTGGALSLLYSTVKFVGNSNIIFQDNHAKEYGGAIYIVSLTTVLAENFPIGYKQSCFYEKEQGAQVSFIHNYATLGGTDIYGASSYETSCTISGNSIFKFINSVSNFSSITSDPIRVCFCPVDDNPSQLCRARDLLHQETRFPGEEFTISLVVVGYNYGTITSTVYANLLESDYTAVDDPNQSTHIVDFRQCNNLQYATFSNKSSEMIVFTAKQRVIQTNKVADDINRIKNTVDCSKSTPCPALLTTPIYVNVTLEDCPLGFELYQNMTCGCDGNLYKQTEHLRTNVTCEISNHTGYIYRQGTVWVGIDQSENNPDTYLLNKECPHHYCNTSRVAVDLTQPDIQCVSNRAGVLCGKCAPGYSLQIGGNQCIKCPNNNTLALLLFFAAAGFLLVFFIKILDLTVANGTINGLIFYSNIIWRYSDILFSLNYLQNKSFWILKVPIAWINLDFGIESCFYDGLDQSGKSLLQFVFPVYIWSIAGLIILVSHYSTRATKLFGNNSVAVLATLFLLSYGKLFQTIADIFTYAELADSNNSTLTVWSFDGNVRYGQLAHIAPIIAALLFLLFFCLPFTLTILLVPCLKSKSNLKPLRWINTLKPFFDTYYGPLKHKIHYQCWTGTLLLVRVVLLSVFAATSTRSPNANILLLVLTALLLLMYSAMVGLLYKKWYVSLLENMYILNLIFLGSSFLFYEAQGNDNYVNPVPFMSIGLALFQFACVIIFHFVQQFKKWFVRKPKENVTIQKASEHRPLQDCAKDNIKYYNTHFREPLLESEK